jgi:capsular exopolysaccharide synthesis family protein
MSEILDFLKNETAPKKRSSVYPMSGTDTEAFTQPSAPAASESSGRDVYNAQTNPGALLTYDAFKEEIIPAEVFDFSNATAQMQRAMDPGTIMGEQFRILRTRLSLLQKQNGIKKILITSTVPQEGKSFTSHALAGIFAQEQGKRVVIIDADLRKMGSGREYGLNLGSETAGTTQVLQGTSEFRKSLLKSTGPEFWFLPSGPLPPNPSELLSAPEMEKMIRFAAERFDWVIVDSPPALALSDPNLIAPLCDGVVFVVRANSTPAKLAQEAMNKIGHDHICGVVLNRKKQIHSSRHYYQYYSYKNQKQK